MQCDSEDWARARDLFLDLAELDAERREAALDRLRAEDPSLAAEVESLLSHDPGPAAGENSDAPLTRFGPYVAVRRLGAGGMGEVFLARRDDGEFEREVAVKLLREGAGGPDLVARFLRERQTLAALSHESIVRLLDGGTTAEGRPYFVMEYVEGVPFDQHARGLDLRARLELFQRVLEAVAHAHSRGVVHRDLKPSNVLVREDGAVRLVDFGIARLLGTDGDLAPDHTLTRTGQRIFTPEYASPEQIRGERTTPATDVFALGALLYELLAECSPWPAEGSLHDLERAIVEAEPPPPSRQSTGTQPRALRGDLDTITLKCLERDPGRRYPDAAALADDLNRHLGGRTIHARRATSLERGLRLVRRKPWHTAALVATLVAVAASGWILNARASEKARQANLRAALPGRLDTVDHLMNQSDLVQAGLQMEAVWDDLLTLDDPGDLEAIARTRQVSLDMTLGRLDEVFAGIEEARASLPRDGSDLDALLTVELGYIEMNALAAQGRFQEAEESAQQALELAEAKLDPAHHLRLGPAVGLARVQLHLKRSEQALATLDRVRPLVEGRDIDQDKLLGQVDGLRGRALLRLGSKEEALPALEAGLAVLRWHYGESHKDVAEITTELARACLELRRMDDAWDHAQNARAAYRVVHNPQSRSYVLEIAGQIAFATGEKEEFLGILEENLENVEAHLLPKARPQWCMLQYQRGWALLGMDAAEDALEPLELALGLDENGEVPEGAVTIAAVAPVCGGAGPVVLRGRAARAGAARRGA